ncbi:MAG TPA: NADH-quinone oxidoreductase subunit M [Vicinamibacteria bacterium]|jgi:NADH-quinone oxidoreductase subunit M|nr:NADH-quinone oxidoreductase subunit M [Vicinamibacteria bacterium]
MDFFEAHLLSIVTYTPLLGALVLLILPLKGKDEAVRWIANIFGWLGFLVSLPLWFLFDRGADGFQFVERGAWIPSIGVQYLMGVDGISTLLVLLTTLLGAIAILSSWTAITDRVRQFYVFLLLLQTGMLGVFCSLDMFLFYVFWEVMLVPMYFLIGIWGGSRRLYAAIKFFLYTLVGSVVMLLGILALYFKSKELLPAFAQTGTFDVTQWYLMAIPADLQFWVFAAFFLGFAIKVPMFPFHTWLPDAHVEAPTAGSVILAGVLLKMGTYGFIRFSLPLLPDATLRWVPLMGTLALIGIVYAALVTLVQQDMKKLIAYSSVSHLGFCMLGMFALNPVGLQGSVLQMVNHGLSTGGLFLIVGLIYERRHTKDIAQFGGLAHVMPVYATLTLLFFLASMGLPLLNGFVGELMILVGAFAAHPVWAYWAVLGVVLGAAYLLWLYQRVFWGKITNEENAHLKDLGGREIMTLVPLLALCFWIGIYPAPVLAFLERPLQTLAHRLQPERFAAWEPSRALAANTHHP